MLHKLDGDARMYRVFARYWKGFYAGAYREREPLFMFLLRCWLRIVGWSDAHVRSFSVVLYALLVAATGCFIAKLSGAPMLGLVGSCAMALNPAWWRESTRGLRTELITLLLLATLAAWLWTSNGWLLGACLGLLALTQTRAASHMLLPFFWALLPWTHWTFGLLLQATLICWILYLPHLFAVAKRHGSFSWVQDRYARYFANIEFGQGLPKNSYVGKPMTWREYYFSWHTGPEVVADWLLGWVEATVYLIMSPLPGLHAAVRRYHKHGDKRVGWYLFAQLPLLYFTFAGAMLCLHHPAHWWVPVLALWSTLPFGFLYHKRLVEPFRNTARIYPLWLFCLLMGLTGGGL